MQSLRTNFILRDLVDVEIEHHEQHSTEVQQTREPGEVPVLPQEAVSKEKLPPQMSLGLSGVNLPLHGE